MLTQDSKARPGSKPAAAAAKPAAKQGPGSAAKPAPKPAPRAASKPAPGPAHKPAQPPSAKAAAKPGQAAAKAGGYGAQQQAQSPAGKPIHAQGATLINNRPEREQGKPAGQDASKEKPRAPGSFLVNGQPFASLAEVHDWLMAAQPADPQIVIQATPGSQVDVSAQTTWHYYKPKTPTTSTARYTFFGKFFG